ncbi:MAG: L-seryl-tRNA(Sec) selenium transferase [Rhodospirillaceae bacterium]|nr:L-seryl-tRNA(Sec) selenium transferase [Rhodospirillaceae bacterium]|tara:strand:+ start:3631 stop:5073 length:1443 start_codon:yes stop_codon:yes gene_type:complete
MPVGFGMTDTTGILLSSIPSVDKLLRTAEAETLIDAFGRQPVTDAVRSDLAHLRQSIAKNSGVTEKQISGDSILARVTATLESNITPSLRPVFNLTGTVLHTNLGRAPLPEEAVEAIAAVSRGASNLEYNLETGRRGDRDVHLEEKFAQLIGAEAVTIVNNNAAAVLLILNALALRKEVIVSRGELIEIGGAFRIPDIMSRAGAKLREVGTTNRTHARDFEEAISSRTALLMKVHTSNYEVQGFTAAVSETELAEIAHKNDLPFVIDLGSGTMTDLEQFGLPHEPTAQEALAAGADLVSFSGDKLLGGPQAGIIAGRADLIAKIKKNPMKRAMRCDKMTIAALETILRLYADPDRLAERIPALRLLARKRYSIKETAKRIETVLAAALGEKFEVLQQDCQSQIGSGSLPTERLDSIALVVRPTAAKGIGTALKRLATAFRRLPVPVIGRIQDDALWLDLRCLESEIEDAFSGQLKNLAIK